MRLYTAISKAEPQDDGSLIVVGTMTDEARDSQGEIVKYEAAKKAASEWTARNIREMHDPKKAVGKAIDVMPDDDSRSIGIRVRISAGAPDTQAKILDGTLSGFSIGGEVHDGGRVARKTDDGTVVELTSFSLSEVSVVDAPANPNSTFEIAKAIDGEIVMAEIEAVEKAEEVEVEAEVEEESDAEKRIRELTEKIGQLEEKLAASATEDEEAEKAEDMPEEVEAPASKISADMREAIHAAISRHVELALDELVDEMDEGAAAESVEVADDDIMEAAKSSAATDLAKKENKIEKSLTALETSFKDLVEEFEKNSRRIERIERAPVLEARPAVVVEKALGAASDRLAGIGYSDPGEKMLKAMAHIINSNPDSESIPKDQLRTQLALLTARI